MSAAVAGAPLEVDAAAAGAALSKAKEAGVDPSAIDAAKIRLEAAAAAQERRAAAAAALKAQLAAEPLSMRTGEADAALADAADAGVEEAALADAREAISAAAEAQRLRDQASRSYSISVGDGM